MTKRDTPHICYTCRHWDSTKLPFDWYRIVCKKTERVERRVDLGSTCPNWQSQEEEPYGYIRTFHL